MVKIGVHLRKLAQNKNRGITFLDHLVRLLIHVTLTIKCHTTLLTIRWVSALGQYSKMTSAINVRETHIIPAGTVKHDTWCMVLTRRSSQCWLVDGRASGTSVCWRSQSDAAEFPPSWCCDQQWRSTSVPCWLTPSTQC